MCLFFAQLVEDEKTVAAEGTGKCASWN